MPFQIFTLNISISSKIFKNFHSTKNIDQILLPKISYRPEEFLHAHTRITYKSSKLPLKGRPLLVLFVITTFKMALGFLMLLYRVMKMDILSGAHMVCTSLGNCKPNTNQNTFNCKHKYIWRLFCYVNTGKYRF